MFREGTAHSRIGLKSILQRNAGHVSKGSQCVKEKQVCAWEGTIMSVLAATQVLPPLTGEYILEVFHSCGQLAVLYNCIFYVLETLNGVDALSPVLADVSQRLLDILDIIQCIVELA